MHISDIAAIAAMVTNMTDTLNMAVCFAERKHKDCRIIFHFATINHLLCYPVSSSKVVVLLKKVCWLRPQTRARCGSDVVDGSHEL